MGRRGCGDQQLPGTRGQGHGRTKPYQQIAFKQLIKMWTLLFIVDGVWWCGGMLGCAKWLRYHNNQMSDSASSRRLSKVIASARHYTKVSSVLWLNLAPIKSFPQVRQHEHTISPAHCSPSCVSASRHFTYCCHCNKYHTGRIFNYLEKRRKNLLCEYEHCKLQSTLTYCLLISVVSYNSHL